jgi:uncharacterized protein YndB with AHSA1/START domain
MNTTKNKTAPRLVVRRTFDAPRARVYAAWTDPKQVCKWAGTGETSIQAMESDQRAGGTYRTTFLRPDGDRWVVRGVFREMQPPERLSYTWVWEEDKPEDEIETLVTVEFHDLGGDKTELVLTHEQFATEESRNGHEAGWTEMLGRLAAYLPA